MRYKKMEATPREQRGTQACRLLRREGRLPGVIYGGKDGEGKPNREVHSITVSRKELEGHVHEGIKFIDVTVGSDEAPTIIKDLQWDAFDDRILHVDFERIDLSDPVTVNVPLDYKGIAKGQKIGGRLIRHMNSVSVRGLPRELPETLVVRIDDIEAGDNLRVSDIKVPEGIEVTSNKDDVLIEVKIKRAAVETTEGEGDEDGAEGGEAPAEE